jgi:hypothetical protein
MQARHAPEGQQLKSYLLIPKNIPQNFLSDIQQILEASNSRSFEQIRIYELANVTFSESGLLEFYNKVLRELLILYVYNKSLATLF